MRVWQPGTHLSSIKKVEVDDWSWRRTRRRIAELARLAKPYKVRTAFSVVSLLAATATALAPPFLAKYAVDDGIRRHDLGKLWWIVGAFVVAGLLNWAMSYVQTYLTGWVGERILADLRIVLFRHLQRLSLGFYERTRAGVIISRLTNDVEAIDQLVTDGVTSLVQNSLTLIGTAILLFVLDWRLALATLAVIPLMGIATVIFRTRSTRAYRAVRERLGLVTATLAEDIAGMRVVQAFTRESANTRNFKAVTERYRDSNMETVVLNALYFPFVDLLSSIALAVVLGYGGHLYFNGDVTLGTLFAFMLYVQNFFDPVQQLSQLYNTFLSATAALDKIMDVMEEEPEVLDRPGAEALPHVEGRVVFDRVRFGYGKGPDVLHELDLDVPAGTTVALVGHTGAGKSTIAKLLARFYDPRDGRITIDGHDLRDVTQASLRAQIGVVTQETFLFSDSILYNIAYGRLDAPFDDIARAARQAHAEEFIADCPDGYQTLVGERGVRLSGGQRQRIAIARAFLRNPPILILDEATSDLDAESEFMIQQALAELMRDRTVLVIAHRLATVRNADRIVVVHEGRIAEMGRHDELLARDGLYRRLYALQMEGVAG